MIFDSSILPSRCVPYQFKQLEMRAFGVPQIMDASRAVSLGSIGPMIEALDSVINVDVNDLTDGDFYYLLTHQRVKSYVRSPLVAAWTCGGVIYREQGGLGGEFTLAQIRNMVEEYEAATEEEQADMLNPDDVQLVTEECGHYNEVDIKFDMLKSINLPETPLPEVLDYPRVRTLVDTIAYRKDPALRYIVDAARWVRKGNTLEEKIEHLKQQETLELFELAFETQMTIRHGMSSTVDIPCARCGADTSHSINIGPDTFLQV